MKKWLADLLYRLHLSWRRVKPITCATGKCRCRTAADCYFKRCGNCDSITDADGKTLLDCASRYDGDECPDCGCGGGRQYGVL